MVNADGESIDLDGVRDFLEGRPVVFALLFGSHARGTAGPDSDVDIALRLPDELDDRERFRLRNRIDAELQQFANGRVDVSDIEALPTEVAYAALRDGGIIVGDESTVRTYRKRVADTYEETADERERERRAFIDRLARGDV
jgi:predicted nucleotidyltransferase